MAHHQPAITSWFCLVLLTATFVAACGKNETVATPTFDSARLMKQVDAWQAEANRELNNSANRLISQTMNASRQGASEQSAAWQEAWRHTHERWLTASLLSGRGSGASTVIDAWPIEPGFIDSLPLYPGSGIVNDLTLPMSDTMVRDQHHYTDDREVTLGLHVIEYYAFGRDYAQTTANANSDRRRQYLSIVAGRLQADLKAFIRNHETSDDNPLQPVSIFELLKKLHEKSQAIFSEFNRLGEHNSFSKTSVRNIEVQLTAIATLLDEPVGLNQILIEMDPAKAEVLNKTIIEAIEIVAAGEEIDEAGTSRGILLTSAISHQLGDFVRLQRGAH